MPTKVTQKEAVSEWSTIFPNKVDTKNNSCIFMKKLFAIALSNILYLRQILPDRAFRDKVVDGLLLKILQNEVEFPPASRLITWARGCFDALEKSYLKTVIIGIHSNADDLETAIESYSFRFTYAAADNSGQNTPVSMNLSTQAKTGQKSALLKRHSFESIKSSALSVLRTLLLASKTMGELPGNVAISMKLLYFDDVTPPDYEPPGFRPADYSSYRYISETMSLLVGNVDTGYHDLELRMRTDKETFQKQMTELRKHDINETKKSCDEIQREGNDVYDGDSHLTPRSVNLTGLDKDDEVDESQKVILGGGASAPLEIDTPNPSTVATPGFSGSDKRTSNEFIVDEKVSDTNEKDINEVQCPCMFSGDDGVMIVCDSCRKWQHSVCFRIIEYDNIPKVHICDKCAEYNNDLLEYGETDPSLLGLEDADKMRLCNYRRLLIMCRNIGSGMTLTQIEISRHLGASVTIVKELTSKLTNKQVLIQLKNSSGRSTRKSAKATEWKIDRQELDHEFAVIFSQKIRKCHNSTVSDDLDVGLSMDADFDDEVVHHLTRKVKNASLSQNEETDVYLKRNSSRSKRVTRKIANDGTEAETGKQHKTISKKRKNLQLSPVEAKKIKASISRTPQPCLQ